MTPVCQCEAHPVRTISTGCGGFGESSAPDSIMLSEPFTHTAVLD